MTGALDRIERLRAVRFDWSPGAPQSHTGPDLGFIAEEVAPVVPEVVARDEHGNPSGVDYARLTALLVEAVQSQQKQIEELQIEVRHLRAELSPVTHLLQLATRVGRNLLIPNKAMPANAKS